MTEEEKLRVYKEGYRDGYNDAVKFYIKDPYINTRPDHFKCSICGRTGVSAVVCTVTDCPTRATSSDYSTGRFSIGAAGSDYLSNLPTGANGPKGY